MKPRLLDLFCGAGGCSMGYHRADFEVVGVDNRPMPRYPFEFHQADALEFLAEHGKEFDVIHASPPCQSYSENMRHLANPQPKLIEPVRELLLATEKFYVIENVEGAPCLRPLLLCGTMFGLKIQRHRLFESNVNLKPDRGCRHYFTPMNPHRATSRSDWERKFGEKLTEKIWLKEMGVEWMSKDEGREAIPPAYTEFIGRQLIERLS